MMIVDLEDVLSSRRRFLRTITYLPSIANTHNALSTTKREKNFSDVRSNLICEKSSLLVDLSIVEEKYGNHIARIKEHRTGGDISDASTESTDSENEDDDGVLVSQELDAQIQATLQAIRGKDPRVYDERTKFYSNFDDEQPDKSTISKTQTKPMYLNDYHRENLLKGNVHAEVEDEQPLTYAQQQDDLRQTVIKEMHSVTKGLDTGSPEGNRSDEADDFLVKKAPKTSPDLFNVNKGAPKLDPQTAERDPETFLSKFLSTRAWVTTDGSKPQPFESDDEEEERRADIFEEAYNLRFEDPKGSNEKLLSHARDAAAKYSVRKDQSNSRKKGRELERAKKEGERRERDVEKARLRKLRIADAEEKIKKIKDAAGLNSSTALEEQDWATFIDEGWDDDRWEQEMEKRFGDEYYAHRELEVGDRAGSAKGKLKKPKWDDDIEIQDIVPDFEKEEAEKPNFHLVDDESTDGTPIIQLSDDESLGDPRRSTKKTLKEAYQKKDARQQRRRIEEIVDQKLKVDDTLAGFGTKHAGHFRYRETSPLTFGLTPNDILMATDSQLNQYVGLKKMAAFRDKEKKKKDKKRLGKKARLRQWRKETFGDENGSQESMAEVLGSHALGNVALAPDEQQGGNVRGGKKARSRKSAKAS